ncbi:Cochaperone protein [Coemansia javaensis]|uniref:Cochaperone protein n=1 Tax=Coemansia javaensis TaxID=2761396 RepID=A0A9W8HAF1_9FUNG|nr:Cochaperone protein [Coemansia javaensis]
MADTKKAANALFQRANEAYFDDEFEQAEALYTQAIAADGTAGEYYLRRAQVHVKLGNTDGAAADAQQAAQLLVSKSDQLRQYFRALCLHGELAAELKQYDAAAESLRKAATINPSHAEVKALLDKVEPLTTPAPAAPAAVGAAAIAAAAAAAPTKPKREQVRHEWYQTDDSVILEVFIKRVQKEAAKIEFEERGVSLSIKMATGADNNYEFEPLAHAIVPGASTFEVLSTKIEVRMKKAQAGRKWDHLEEPEEQQQQKKAALGLAASRKGVSWDAIAAAADKETRLKPNEQSVNELFQAIYRDADEDTRRAMMKSYVESNGTSLSTDWKSVSQGPVETLPPADAVAKPFNM